MNIHCGNNIKLIRELHNLTQTYVALKIGICEKTYRNIEKAEQMPDEKIINLLSIFYKISVEKIIVLTTDEIINKILK